jgi:hypothetical protein
MKKKRPHADTTVPYIPADPQDIMAAAERAAPASGRQEHAEGV